MKAKIGVLIATHNRPEELRLTLESLSAVKPAPEVVVVCDSSGTRERQKVEEVICESRDSNFLLELVTSAYASSASQRNLAAERLLKHGVDFIQVLDDDTIPSATYISKLLALLQSNPSRIGASGVTLPEPPPASPIAQIKKFVYWIVGLESYKAGCISRAGCGIPAKRNQQVQETEWLIGCSLWRAEVFRLQKYLDTLPGASLFEDTHFSMRAALLGKLVVDPTATLHHSYSENQRPDIVRYAHRFNRNRWFVIQQKKIRSASVFWYLTSVFALTLSHVGLACTLKSSSEREIQRRAALASIKGAVDAILDKPPI